MIVGNENVMLDEPLKNHTSMKCGGPADFLITPCTVESLREVINFCNSENLPVFVMGNGTNLIVRDKGIRGVVIKLSEKFSRYKVKGNIIEAEAGIFLSRLARIALENELTGMEFAEGIPGTLGGAVAMNAGAYDGEMADIVIKTYYLDNRNNISTVEGDQHKFGKRTSFIQQEGGIVIKSEILLEKGNKEEIRKKMEYFSEQRRQKQPLDMPSAGSIFKRPEGYFAGKLIQDCGLKGYRIGGAEVSCKHCGFIVNTNNASSADIISLIEYIQQKVKEKFGVTLQTEVKIVGEE